MLKKISLINIVASVIIFLLLSLFSYILDLVIRPKTIFILLTLFFVGVIIFLYSLYLERIKKIKYKFVYLFLFNIFMLFIIFVFTILLTTLPVENKENDYIRLEKDTNIYQEKFFFYLVEVKNEN